MIKVFVTDMDGTLLNEDHIISPQVAEAIKTLQGQGIEFLIATGRSYHSANPLLAAHGIQAPMINLNGAIFTDTQGQGHHPLPLETSTVDQMIDFLNQENIQYSLMTEDYYYLPNPEAFIQGVKAIIKKGSQDLQSAFKFETELDYVRDLADYRLNPDQLPLKIMVITEDLAAQAAFKDQFENQSSLDITSSGPDNLEVTHQQAQKGLALEKYVQSKGWTLADTATIGDSLNDRSMLRMSPLSFAMANASDDVKEMARYIAPANTEDGVAQVIYDILAGIYTP